ncbi:MAG: SxtJ family membrane protein [Deltaproteobacteria bacterium]|nr:SxtJ family membrane protein [Deltaproteobacteria bacterium]
MEFVVHEKRELRQFGLVIGSVFTLLAGLLYWKGSTAWFYYLVPAFLFFSFGLLWPLSLKPVYKIWMKIAFVMGLFMTKVILSLLFYLVVTPIGILARIFGKDFLKLKIEKERDSYWIKREQKEINRQDYERQY